MKVKEKFQASIKKCKSAWQKLRALPKKKLLLIISILIPRIFLISLLGSFLIFTVPEIVIENKLEKKIELFLQAYQEEDVALLGETLHPSDTEDYEFFLAQYSFYFDVVEIPEFTNSISYELNTFWTDRKKEANIGITVYYSDDNGLKNQIYVHITAKKRQREWFLSIIDLDEQGSLPFHHNLHMTFPELQIEDENIIKYNVKPYENVGFNTFWGYENIIEISLPANYDSLDPHWFYNTPKLMSVKIDENSPFMTSVDGVVYNKDMTELIFYPTGKIEQQEGPNSIFQIPDTVQTIKRDAFLRNTGLRKIIFPSSVKRIDRKTFHNSVNIQELVFAENLEFIGEFAFENCSKLETITFPDTLVEISNSAFKNCKNLQEITISSNSSLKKIGYAAFENCESLEYFYIPKGVTSIENWVFQGCSSLQEVEYKNHINYIGMYAFRNCKNLQSLNLRDIEYVGMGAFSECKNINLSLSQQNGWHQYWDLGLNW